MKIQTKDGFFFVDVNEVSSVDIRKNTYGDNTSYDIMVTLKGNPLNMVYTMENWKDALEAAETLARSLSGGVKSDAPRHPVEVQKQTNDYIDGFKAGCEYTLKLNKESE